jgi:hypothetical protein
VEALLEELESKRSYDKKIVKTPQKGEKLSVLGLELVTRRRVNK